MHPRRASKYEFDLSNLRTFQGLPGIPPHQDLECCIICLEPIASTSVLREFPCGHLFHQVCADDWVCNFDSRCPICRQAFYYLRYPRMTKPPPPAVIQESGRSSRWGSENVHTHGTFHSLKHWCKTRLSTRTNGSGRCHAGAAMTMDSNPASSDQ
ncbi:hypothetical protein BDV37DRAFT_269945 [Aspergillus pseudonomiae]|uniref:RING-type domain-containing protein n=1 Tax=Aspergillus pseudonomiae TaxID=1506151 RepID=A0A5N7DLF0_9EURO|nr:uncharacterized protein BDV37DRAFT_269945 [Aspergillus pseudonomiae]KAE8406308.1 hypothetical protein BDV37DRAFT_269945 [Aspergillus pseudonomiae]